MDPNFKGNNATDVYNWDWINFLWGATQTQSKWQWQCTFLQTMNMLNFYISWSEVFMFMLWQRCACGQVTLLDNNTFFFVCFLPKKKKKQLRGSAVLSKIKNILDMLPQAHLERSQTLKGRRVNARANMNEKKTAFTKKLRMRYEKRIW